MPKNYTSRITLILAITLAFAWAIVPNPWKLFDSSLEFGEKTALKPGIDIKGGASLLYQINPPAGAMIESDLSERVIAILKRRVDPDGVRNLIWRAQGPTRIEIQMPAAAHGDEARDSREKYMRARQQVEKLNLREPEILALVRGSAADRARLKELTAGSIKRQNLFDSLIANDDAVKAAKKAGDTQAAGRAAAAFDNLVSQIPDTNIDLMQVEQFLQKPQTVGKRLEEIRTRLGDFPAALAALEGFLKAQDEFDKRKGTIDDVGELKRLLRGSGVLEFHILVTDELGGEESQKMRDRLHKRGPAVSAGDTMRWYRVDKPEELKRFRLETYNDEQWILAYCSPVAGSGQTPRALDKRSVPNQWNLEDVRAGRDAGSAEKTVNFSFDTQGAVYFHELTSANIGKPLAIVLDDKIISAPNIRSAIASHGQITGDYTDEDIDYMVRTLKAGSLPAQLAEEPLMERSVGPQLGEDNLRRGLMSCVWALIAVAVFMIGYYHFSGFVAVCALLLNLVMIMGSMAIFGATFTLSAIAGVVLTIGMSVDANVLIFERLREEQQRGLALRMALRNAYDRAFTAIFDSNVVTAITCIILFFVGSEEVKGFGLTLFIGIVSSMFTALFVTKTIFGLMIDKGGLTKLGSLPGSFPKIDIMLRPHIDWMGKARYFATASVILIVVGVAALVMQFRKGEMLDVEFAAGTAVQFDLKGEGLPIDKVRSMIEQADAKALPSPSVVSVGEKNRAYEVITPNPNGREVKDAVLKAMQGQLQTQDRSDFIGRGKKYDDVAGQQIFPVTNDTAYGAGFTPQSSKSYLGGVAIVLRDLSPALSPEDIRKRLDNLRLEPGSAFADLAPRSLAVDGPAGANDPATTAVVFLADPVIASDQAPDQWRNALADPLWKLVNEAVYSSPRLERVLNIDASVAADMQRDAILALVLSNLVILIYVWLRFGDLRYGTATIVAMLHDTVLVMAFVGLSHIIKDVPILRDVLQIDQGFRINLTLVAAVLTIMGYSMVDTIVVFDRIRENRGKFGKLSLQSINDSINQTLSRTLLTGGTAFISVLIMYYTGGSGIHGFTFVMFIGILVGTYSSIAIASPILLVGNRGEMTDQRAVGK